LSHLNNELALLGKGKINSEDALDTLSLARDKFPGSPVSLDALCKRYRIDNSNRAQHTALVDCDLLSKVYINLLDQKEPTLNFQNQDNEKTSINLIASNQYYKKVIKPTEDELKLHKDYLKTSLKKNFFN
jgi:DNA polymerase-3 subunit epsilon